LKLKREKSTSTVGHYVRNADLLPAVIEAKELGKVTNKLISMIQLIAERYSRKGSFGGYSFREDMVSSAVENLCKNALKFDHVKYNNPFAFYTTAIHRSFLQYMAEEKKHRNLRDTLLLQAGANPSFNFLDKEKDESFFEVKESDDIVVPDLEFTLVDGELTAVEAEHEVEAEESDPSAASAVTSEVKSVKAPKEHKIKYRDRIPGPVIKYGPGDYEIHPVTGAFILKKKEDPPVQTAEPKKKPKVKLESKVEVKAVAKSRAPAKKSVAKKPAVKAVAAKKPATKKPAVKAVAAKKSVAKKPAAKKSVAKKPAAKKVAPRSK
jgi:DNA-directed RNA polymerase specialized sigma subunit